MNFRGCGAAKGTIDYILVAIRITRSAFL